MGRNSVVLSGFRKHRLGETGLYYQLFDPNVTHDLELLRGLNNGSNDGPSRE